MLGNPLVLVAGLLVGFMLPRLWLSRRKSSRLNSFNKQLPDTITLIANALRAAPVLQVVELVVRESRPPISTSSAASSARSTLASRSKRRSRTWSGVSGPTISS